MPPPEVSIILPVYNAEAFLDEALESILQQSFLQKGGLLEVSAFDDGSSDGSAAVLQRWAERLTAAFPETFTFTSGANEERLRAARRGEARAEAYAEEERPSQDPPSRRPSPDRCSLCARATAPEALQRKKANGAGYCESCRQLSKEEWQAKRREAYERRTGLRRGGAPAAGEGGAQRAQRPQGVPCGIGFACNSAIRQSRGTFLCRFDADDVMHPERVERQVEALRAQPPELRERTILGTGFVRMPEDATPRYTQWLNDMTEEQLMSQRFREVTLLHPTWMYHRRVWETVGGYTHDTTVGEDIVFFHQHLEKGGRLLRLREPLLHYRCHPGQRSWRLPRREVQSAKAAAFERQVLSTQPWREGFGVVGAGRDARDFCKALSPEALRKVRAFYEVDPKKIGKSIAFPFADGTHQVPVLEQPKLQIPFVVCVALERGYQVLSAIARDQPTAQEGVDYFHLV
ncbi:unnamed protein product [Durusdinium trenchii]|uniref:Glycosyltransferase 2-like domain-containing protein n=1 Tax=Durusdinium trenchii TaxID=1381693 RepID=A0ABP0PJ78_9DINO